MRFKFLGILFTCLMMIGFNANAQVSGYDGPVDIYHAKVATSKLFINWTTAGDQSGRLTPFVNSFSETMPLIPFVYNGFAEGYKSQGWTTINIPSSFPDDTKWLALSGSAIITNNSSIAKGGFFYISFSVPSQSGIWDTPTTLTAYAVSGPNGVRKNFSHIIVPVENRQFRIRIFQHLVKGHYQDADEVSGYAFNLRIASYAVAKAPSSAGLTSAEVQAMIDTSIAAIPPTGNGITAIEAQALIDASIVDKITAAQAQALIDAKVNSLTATTTSTTTSTTDIIVQ